MQLESRWIPVQGQQRSRPVVSRNNPVIYLANSLVFIVIPVLYFELWSSNFAIFTAHQQSFRIVILSVVSVIVSTEGVPCDHYAWCIIRPHHTRPLPHPYTGTSPKREPPLPHYTKTSPYRDHLAYGHQTYLNLFNLDVAGTWHPTGILSCKFIGMFSFGNEHPGTVINSNNGNSHLVCLRAYQILYDFGMVPAWLEVIYLSPAAILELDLYTRHNNVTLFSLGYFLVTGCHFQSWSQHIGLPSQLLEWNWSKLSPTNLVFS